MFKADRDSNSRQKKAWVRPELKMIRAGSAEADVGGDVQDGGGGNPSSKS